MTTDKLLSLWRDLSTHSDIKVRLPDGTVYSIDKIKVHRTRNASFPVSMLDLRPPTTKGTT